MTKTATKTNFLKLAGEMVRETEKAIQMKCEIDTHSGRRTWNVWFPKSRASLCEGGIRIEDWLYNAKADEVVKSFRGGFLCFIEVPATREELIEKGLIDEETETPWLNN